MGRDHTLDNAIAHCMKTYKLADLDATSSAEHLWLRLTQAASYLQRQLILADARKQMADRMVRTNDLP